MPRKKKEVPLHLCEDNPREWRTQSVYMPDPGEIKGPVHCGVCDAVMRDKRDCYGPTSSIMAMSGSKRKYDSFICPLRDEDWHKQVVALRNEARNTASMKHKEMLLDEADEVLLTRKATMDVGPLRGY